MSYNPEILPKILRARSLNERQLANRLGLGEETLDAELKRDPVPKQSLLESIAHELALPSFVFFMKDIPPVEGPIPDFRNTKPANSPKSREALKVIQFVAGVQKVASSLRHSAPIELPRLKLAPLETIDAQSLNARNFFDISLDDQTKAKSIQAFYNICRMKIEKSGIFVFQESYPTEDGSGFCLWHEYYPAIVINTKNQNHGRRLFTLAHELAHILLHLSGA